MKTYLVTGAAGFIGANYIKYLLHKKYLDDDIKVIILDALTYAGNLGTIKDDIDDKRCFFVKIVNTKEITNTVIQDDCEISGGLPHREGLPPLNREETSTTGDR